MAFIAGAIIGGAASIAGGIIGSKGAKRAADAAAAGSEAEIAYNRETRDLIRQDQEPYRKAGYTALDALMSMTGLGGGGSAPAPEAPTGPAAIQERWDARESALPNSSRSSSYRGRATRLRYDGGPMDSDTYYNVSELGPENVFTKGRVTRPQSPVTIDGETGYVEPNIEGRFVGGYMGSGYGAASKIMPEGSSYGPPSSQPPKDPSQPATMGGQPAAPPSTGIDPNTGYPVENPGGVEGGFNFRTDPGYAFRFKEGMRALDRGAAARGGLLSGGYARKAIRYGQDYASGEYTNVYNRIANIAGLGQTANQTNANAALYTGANMGTAAAQAGYARASGYQGASNAWANAANQVAQLPWDQMNFGGGGSGNMRLPRS